MRLRYLGFVGLAAIALGAPAGFAQKGAPNGEWRAYAGDNGGTRYAPLDQITRDNVKNLTVAWSWKFDNFGGGTSETTPILANGVLYFTVGPRRNVIAVNPGTGETLWTFRVDEGERFEKAPRKVGRGVAYWPDGGDGRIILITPGFHLYALNAKTGLPIPSFGTNGSVDLFKQLDLTTPLDPMGRIGNSSAPVISNGVIVIGPALTQGGTAPNRENVKGDVMAFDVMTGKKKWVFHTIPRFGEKGYETWLNESAEYTGNVGVWGPFSADDELGYVYLATESPTNDGYGGHRPGDNLFSDSIVCLDVKTGKMVWFKQLIRHDIWDYDMPVHPILVDIRVDGRPVKAIAQTGKMALLWVFDRTNGQPVWPIPDVAVEQTDVPTEYTAKTQPIPSKPPAYDVVGIKTDDLIDFTPALREKALAAIKAGPYRLGGPFAPPSVVVPGVNRGTIVAPGFGGGANWQSGAADPETGFVYIGSQTRPFVAGVVKTDPADPAKAAYTAGRGGQVPSVDDLPLIKPPYGRVTAYDLNKGDIAWQIANGDTPPNIKEALAKAGVTNAPPTGYPSNASFVVTKTLLVGGEGAGGRALLHAYDKKTGENIAEITMPGSQTAVPMSYMYQGRQFIVVSVAGRPAGQLVAFSLPVPAPPGGRGRGGAAVAPPE
ncbi:MAG TPA: PQQ-binding-like beta-propeller repeat protein [Vicinamibacterales bacterium]|nr:PQQ-binding-like beta-propeller repeat protein [Vicinamibacterales bacterium]